jgi:EAL domain-containing protein (putative c-di-GMP-specific phosphodiesterase class I)
MRTPDDVIGSIYSLMFRGFYSTAFQPIVDTGSGRAIGYESLLRGPEGTPLADPGRLFNEDNYLPESVRIKLDRACIDSAVRTGKNLPDDTLLFINILGSTLIQLSAQRSDFIALLGQLGIEPGRIVFELSETTSRAMTDELTKCIRRLQQAGMRVALDDIGVRSPYLYHLLCLEPEFLKLDRLFVQGVDRDPRKQLLVDCMARMAERMGVRLIAEGIETAEEFAAMRSLNVPMSQGYYLGRPKPAGHWLADGCTAAIMRAAV